MSLRRRTKGTFKTDKFGRIEVESPQLADFLSSLSSGSSGVLLEPLEVTFSGGVGGADEGYVFDEGTSLEDVLRVICTGVPSTALNNLDLYNGGTTQTSGNANTFLFEVGTEVSLDNFDMTLVGVSEFETDINSLEVSVQNNTFTLAENLTVNANASEIAGSFNVDNTADYAATANVLTLGAATSDYFVSPSTSGGAVSMTSSFTGSAALLAGGEKTTSLSMQHVLPAFVLNMLNTSFDTVLALNVIPTLIPFSINTAIASGVASIVKQDLQAGSDYNNHPFTNDGGYLEMEEILHLLCVPKANFHSGTPQVKAPGATGVPAVVVGGIVAVHELDLDLQALGLIQGFTGVAQTYVLCEFVNTSAWEAGMDFTLNFG